MKSNKTPSGFIENLWLDNILNQKFWILLLIVFAAACGSDDDPQGVTSDDQVDNEIPESPLFTLMESSVTGIDFINDVHENMQENIFHPML